MLPLPRARAAWWRGRPGVPGGAGRGPGLALRTGARPAGRELVPRCLLDARALPGANPPSSQGGWPARRAAPGIGSAGLLALPSRAAGPGHPDSWPGAGRQQHTALRRDVNPRPAAPDG